MTAIFSNWQLTLLAATGIVLSIASGWTTWDGMGNFTREPVLSFMITFGIQGVMLIAAWLIGERIAGRKDKPAIPKPADRGDPFTGERSRFSGLVPDLKAATGLVMLWLMFLSCMATSVFFSFDSLFSTIFSEQERSRAAGVRAQGQVSSLLNDIAALTARRQIEQQTALLQGPAWRAYSGELQRVEAEIPKAIEVLSAHTAADSQKIRQAEAVRTADLATLKARVAQTKREREQVAVLASQAEGQASTLEAALKPLAAKIFEKDGQLVAKQAEMEAELKGIRGETVAGKGPKYRALKKEADLLAAEKGNLELQQNAQNARLSTVKQAISRQTGKLAKLDATIQQLEGELAATSGQKARPPDNSATAIKASLEKVIVELRRERQRFDQAPSDAGLLQMQAACSAYRNAVATSPVLNSSLPDEGCSPGQVQADAARLFSLSNGLAAMRTKCQAQTDDRATAAGQIALARSCLQLSQLQPQDAAAILAKVDRLDRNRDDLAHRFVVTLNAFSDRNYLAFLALAIAVAIDSLVFMSGLFGAMAARAAGEQPVSARSVDPQDADNMIRTALLPDVFRNAASVLEVAQALTDVDEDAPPGNWTHEFDLLDKRSIEVQSLIRKVTNAGIVAGLACPHPYQRDRFLVASDLIAILVDAAGQAFEDSRSPSQFVHLAADAPVLKRYLQPTGELADHPFMLNASQVSRVDRDAVIRCLSVGSTMNTVRRLKRPDGTARYYVHRDFLRVLDALQEEKTGQAQADTSTGDDETPETAEATKSTRVIVPLKDIKEGGQKKVANSNSQS